MVKQFSAQVIENINMLEMGYLNTSTMDNLELKSKEMEKVLEEMKTGKNELNLKELKDGLSIGIFNETLDNALQFVRPSNQLKEDISSVSQQLSNMTVLVSEMKNFTQKAREHTIDAERIFKGKQKEILTKQISDINSGVEDIETRLKEAQAKTSERKEIFEKLDIMKVDLDQQKEKLQGSMGRLRETMDGLNGALPDTSRDVEAAKGHANTMKGQSRYLIDLFASTKNVATDPLRAANAYNNISAAVDESEKTIAEVKSQLMEPAEADKELTSQVNILDTSVTSTEGQLKDLGVKHRNQNETISELEAGGRARLSLFREMKEKLDKIEITSTDVNNIKLLTGKVKVVDGRVKELVNSIATLQEKTKSINFYADFMNDISRGEDFIKQFNGTTNVNPNPNFIEEKKNIFKQQKDTISDKISELKKRIQIVKHHANNIRVGARFTEGSVLELNNPSNLAKSSTYTKFSLQFLADKPNGLLTYIGNPVSSSERLKKREPYYDDSTSVAKPRKGDFMCLEIRDGKVTLVWDLGSETPNILEDEQNVYDQKWHQVIVERFGKLVKLSVKTGEKVTEKKALSEGTHSVFNLDPVLSRIFIGGISPQVQVASSIENRNFTGTISNVMYDNEPLGLWNVKQISEVKGTAVNELTTENSLRFNGNSYVVLQKPDSISFKEQVYVNFSFKTFAKNGLLFLVGDPMANEYFSIELKDGHVLVRYELGSAPITVVTEQMYNDGKWHFVKVNREDKESVLNVDDEENNGFALGMNTDLSTDDNMYIGGFPGRHPYYDVTKDNFDGCIRDLQIGSDLQNLNNNKESFGITSGCSNDFVRTVSFTDKVNQHGYVVQQIKPEALTSQENLQISFKFRTLSNMGLLLMLSDAEKSLHFSVYLTGGTLVLRSRQNEEVRTNNKVFNDNQWHYVTIVLSQDSLKMDIDDENTNPYSVAAIAPIDVSRLSTAFVGGLPPSSQKDYQSNFGDFTGCIGDITLNELFVNFAESTDKQNAQFTKCHLSTGDNDFPSTYRLPSKHTDTPSPFAKPSQVQKQLPPIGNCKLAPIPKTEDAFTSHLEEVRFGDTLWSRYEFSISNDVSKLLENESGFQIQFKTEQANGIIFYITAANSIDFVGLYFVHGKLHYAFDCGSGRGVVALEENFNDGKWHTVMFSRRENKGFLRVDDTLTAEVTSPGSTTALNVKSPMYIGGVPEELSSQVKGHLKSVNKTDYSHAVSSFSGCLRKLKLRDMEYKYSEGRPVNTAPCSDQVEFGNFFHYEGGYIRLFEEFRVRVQFDMLLEIKPRKPDGLIAAVFGNISLPFCLYLLYLSTFKQVNRTILQFF